MAAIRSLLIRPLVAVEDAAHCPGDLAGAAAVPPAAAPAPAKQPSRRMWAVISKGRATGSTRSGASREQARDVHVGALVAGTQPEQGEPTMLATQTANRLALAASLVFACASGPEPHDSSSPLLVQHVRARFAPDHGAQPPAVTIATLKRVGKGGQEVGTLELVQRGRWVTLSGDFQHLPPGVRGIQIREHGNCGGKGARLSGSHYNPTDARHGPPEASERHVGDLGNLDVSKQGTARFHMTTDSLTVIDGGASSVLGRSVVITTRKDDGRSQPDGNAGPAIACGVITAR